MDAGRRLSVGGRNLPAEAVIKVNDVTHTALRNDNGDLTATIGQGPSLSSPYKIEVVVEDLSGSIIARSKPYMYTDTDSTAAR